MNLEDQLSELDYLLDKIARRDAHLRLDREGTGWVVVDTANPIRVGAGWEPVVMMRAPLAVCCRFVGAFAGKHPEATVDWESVREAEGYSVRVPRLRVVEA